MTNELSGEKYVTMSSVIPLVRGLQLALKNMNPVIDIELWLKCNLIEIVSRRLGILESNKIVAKSAFLDARYKRAAFGQEENARNCQTWIMDELANTISTEFLTDNNSAHQESKEPVLSRGSLSLCAHFYTLKEIKTMTTPSRASSLCLRHYRDLPYYNRKSNAMEFWQNISS